jgi:hypothetical protein
MEESFNKNLATHEAYVTQEPTLHCGRYRFRRHFRRPFCRRVGLFVAAGGNKMARSSSKGPNIKETVLVLPPIS